MEKSAYKEMAEVENSHWWFLARRDIISRSLRSYFPAGGAEVLDAGCGTGGNLRLLSGFGRVRGLEMSPEAAEYSRGVLPGTEISTGALPENAREMAGHSFDLVVMLDVLEHINDDQAALLAVKDLLKPGGVLLVTVPAFQWLYGPHDEELHHHRRYSKATLKALASATGLKVERLTFFNFFLFPWVVLSRLGDLFMGRKKAYGMKIPFLFFNRVLYRIFSSESKLLGHMDLPFGSSLLGVFRKER